MKRLVILFFLVGLIGVPCHAAPGKATSYLMDEKATLFDLGMLTLRMKVSDFIHMTVSEKLRLDWPAAYNSLLAGGATHMVWYDFDSNHIIIDIGFTARKQSEAIMKPFISEVFSRLRSSLGIPAVIPEPDIPIISSRFGHIGYGVHAPSKEMEEELRQMIIVKVRITNREDKVILEAAAPLVSNTVPFSK